VAGWLFKLAKGPSWKIKMANVTLTGLSKSFGELTIIADLNLIIADKELVVLVGPSGCGKTTALRMIAGLEESSGGTIHIGDRDVTSLRPGLRNIAMVFQNYALYPHMTVAANIGYGMKARGETPAAIEAAVNKAAKTVALENLLARRPKALSGGQRQRVAIARALVRNPDVFLFDEPLSNLDAKLRVEMRTEIRRLHRELQATMVYVTHDQVEAMTLADRVVVMNGGHIEQAADPMTLYARPANVFVAGFIGAPSMNFISVTARSTPAGPEIELPDGKRIAAPERFKAAVTARGGLSMIMGIRPEHVEETTKNAVLKMTVENVETLGSHRLLIGKLDGQPFTAQVAPNCEITDDGQAGFIPVQQHIHLFDAGTKLSLLELA
jgi:multiple sugar transport system ATP-binding protein